MDDILQTISDLETLFERSPMFMGKNLVSAEEFFTRAQTLRTNLDALPSSRELIAWLRTLPHEQQQEIVAALSVR